MEKKSEDAWGWNIIVSDRRQRRINNNLEEKLDCE
jgi:hypothetical protein